eukprot:3602892-Pyramimonas_sp.AAC.1
MAHLYRWQDASVQFLEFTTLSHMRCGQGCVIPHTHAMYDARCESHNEPCHVVIHCHDALKVHSNFEFSFRNYLLRASFVETTERPARAEVCVVHAGKVSAPVGLLAGPRTFPNQFLELHVHTAQSEDM